MRTLLILLLLISAAGCASVRPAPNGGDPAPAPSAGGATKGPAKGDGARDGAGTVSGEDDDDGHGVLGSILLYLPNRVIDVFDVARFGVDVGPGIGVEAQVTELLQARLISSLAVGVGLQTLRHSPIRTGAEAGFGVGPVGGTAEAGSWYRSPADVRVGLHAAVVGAHAAVEPVEILDLVLGFLFIDIKDDDL